PASAATGGALLVSTTTSDVEQGPLLMVHLSVTLVPTGTPVTVVVGDAGLVMSAVPASMVQSPVPTPAALPANVKIGLLHNVWARPASATGGVARLISTTSSKLEHTPLVTVQRKVTLCPAGTSRTKVVGDVTSSMEAP